MILEAGVPFVPSFAGYSLAIAIAFFLMWCFGPQRRCWHAIALIISLAATIVPFEWKSLSGRLAYNSVNALLLTWGVLGLMRSPRWPMGAGRSS